MMAKLPAALAKNLALRRFMTDSLPAVVSTRFVAVILFAWFIASFSFQVRTRTSPAGP
jgi:hypothetical protein